jgi:hypothetical protein
MTAASPLNRIAFLYHFTDRRNLPLIRSHGGLYPLADLVSRNIEVPAPGGNDWSRDADNLKGMGHYVHLCFRATHPMKYAARQSGRIQDTIFLQIHASVLRFPDVRFTSDVANKSGVESVPIAEAANLIDYEVLYSYTDWKNPEIKQRLKQAEKCEVLVPAFIPLELIRNLDNG